MCRDYGSVVAWRSLATIVILAGTIAALAVLWRAASFTLVLVYVVLWALYALLLVISGEWSCRDWQRVGTLSQSLLSKIT